MQTATRLRILALAPNRWDGPWMNRQQLLSRLAVRHFVAYTNGPWHTWDVGTDEWRAAPWLGRWDRRDLVAVERPARLILRNRRIGAFDRLAVSLAARLWTRALVSGGGGPRVLYLFHPKFARFTRSLPHDILVYHAYDLFSAQGEWPDRMRLAHERLAREADLTLASSDLIAADLASAGARSPIVLANGADYATFSEGLARDAPEDLETISRPRIAYVGALNRKVDLPLLAELAGRRPRWQFVLIGHEGSLDEVAALAFARLKGMRNLHLLGPRRPSQLPAYVARMDVNVMTYRVDPRLWSFSGFPLKLFEYLAAGPPVVSADLPAIRPYGGVLRIAHTADDWEAAIEAALAGADDARAREARRAVARSNTWDDRVRTLERLLLDVARVRSPGATLPVRTA